MLKHAKSIFESERDAANWFSLPNAALSGDARLFRLGRKAGAQDVNDVLARLEFGVYG